MLCEQKRDGQLQHRSRNITPCPPYEKFSLTDWSGRAMTVERSSIGLQFPHYRPFQQPIFLDRTMQFWLRAIPIYASYKICQLRIQFYSKDSREQLWEEQHEWAADKVYSLCSELGGFFLKVAQLIGKPDLAPKAWVKKLVTLCDSAPPTSYSIVKCALEYELGSTVEDLFEYFDCKPIGSASVAQVHRARLKGAKKDVAVKVQHPGVEVLMMNDIRNLRTFAALVQCFDLKFDVLSAVDELEEQVGLEFDFQREARSMDRIANSISAYYKARPPVFVPRSIPSLVTRRVLVMQFMEGTPIMQLGDEMARRGINPSGAMAKLAKQNILKSLTEAYGHMILRDGFFQADPHPGNLLIMEEGKVALLDYGQVKEFTNPIRLGYAKLVVAIAAQNPYDIDQSFKELGVVLGKRVESDPKSYMQMASNLFDTKLPPGRTRAGPFGEDALLQKVQVKNFPKDLFFVLRTIQILRGLSVGMEVPLSCVENWKNIAKEALSVAHEGQNTLH
ncbi:hypothetical protein KP509_23G078000 [Ceratopteris richardii]|uniref:Protein kinase domain-containing protein n=1 Tax=Ceratopteris richardii TaxID=49495 RepID=A0A8T2S3H3_CERRI|nr:hypothetical protein KP509_23G078000 [Ceratopteris richardii]